MAKKVFCDENVQRALFLSDVCLCNLIMAHDAVLESLICGIGYEMTPTEKELENRRGPKPQQQQQKPGPKTPFHQATLRASTTADDGQRLRGGSKLRRAFSLNHYYRNPFRSQKSAPSERDTTTAAVEEDEDVGQEVAPTPADTTGEGPEAKRRVSWRKFLLKIAAQFGGSNLIVSTNTNAR